MTARFGVARSVGIALVACAAACSPETPAPAPTATSAPPPPLPPQQAPTPPRAESIFNGSDLSGWDGDPRYWRVEDGLLTGETTAAAPLERNTFIIYRGAEVEDFELRLEYVVRSDWANSGVQYRSFEMPPTVNGAGNAAAGSDGGRWIVGGYQADIDTPIQYTGILYGERDRGILALRGQQVEITPGGAPRVTGSLGDAQALAGVIHGKDGWNVYRIEARGNRAIHEINGVTMAEIVDNDTVVADPGAKGARPRGVIALQLHTGAPMKIQFRAVTLRPIGESAHP